MGRLPGDFLPGLAAGPPSAAGSCVLLAFATVALATCDGDMSEPPLPQNQAPAVSTAIPDQVVVDSVVLELSAHFTDPDGDALTYTATSADPTVARAQVAGAIAVIFAGVSGSTTVTVRAIDPDGASATATFDVTVPNRPPQVVKAFPNREAPVGDQVVTRVSSHFADPDGDPLTFAAASADTGVATVTTAGDEVTVRGIRPGVTTITVTAIDPEGLSVGQDFTMTVPNRAPQLADTLPDLVVEVGGETTTDLTQYFADPDGEELTFTATSSIASVAEVDVAGIEMTVGAIAKGTAAITVMATDAGGLLAAQEFKVTVPNRAPQVSDTISDLELEVGSEVVEDVSRRFADPDGDTLTFAAVSSSAAVAVAAVSGERLTVAAIAKGTAIIEVTATDNEGLAASLSFSVMVPNRAPLASEALPDVEIEVGDLVGIDPASHFTDPDGDVLTFAAESSDVSRVTAVVADDRVRMSGVAKGTATVTITATDPEGLAVAQSFRVMVPNRAPEASEALPDVEVEVGELVGIDPASHFTDPDGDALTFAAESSDESLVAANVADDQVRVGGVAKGIATVTVTATDTEGLAVAQSFRVRVPNRAPLASEVLPDVEIEVGDRVGIDPASHFTDPDGDALAFTAESSDESLVAVGVAGDQVSVSGVAKGIATVTITATDTEGLAVVQSFRVRVPNRAPLASEALPDIEVGVGEAARVDPASHFTDPDGDELTFAAESADESLVVTSVADHEVTVRGVGKGRTRVTVTATDTEGLAVAQDFRVTVPNRAPRVAVALPDIRLEVGGDWGAGLSAHFTDPDGDPLLFVAESSDSGVAATRIEGESLRVNAVAAGTATVTVTASDSAGLEVSQAFRVLVPNRGPVVTALIPPHRVRVGRVATVYLPDHFDDPDGDTLTFSAGSTVPAIASADVAGSDLRIRAIAKGISTVTVYAADPGGLVAGISFDVLVPNRAPQVATRFDDRRLEVGEEAALTLSNRFSDPDGDTLAHVAESSSPSVATAAVVDHEVRITAVAAGTSGVTVTAFDPEGASAAQNFTVTVVETPTDHNPQTVGTIPDANLGAGDPDHHRCLGLLHGPGWRRTDLRCFLVGRFGRGGLDFRRCPVRDRRRGGNGHHNGHGHRPRRPLRDPELRRDGE